jgi:hypothetical protein
MLYVFLSVIALLSSRPAEVPVRIDHTVKGTREGRFKRRWQS